MISAVVILSCLNVHAQKGGGGGGKGGGGGGKGGGKGAAESSGPILPEDYQQLDLEEKLLLAELSTRAVAWLTNRNFSTQSAEQTAPFFGHASDPEQGDKKGGKGDKEEDREPPDKKNDPLDALRDSLQLTPGLMLACVLTQAQQDLLARGLDARANALPAYANKHAEVASMLAAVRGQGAAAGAGWNLQKLRSVGAEIGRAEAHVALVEARVMSVLLESLEPVQKAQWRKIQQAELESLDEPELKQLARVSQALGEESLALLERAAVWSDKDRRDVVVSPVAFVGDYFGDLTELQPRKQGGGGKKPKGDDEKRMGVIGAFLNMLDRDQRHHLLDLVKSQSRLIDDYQSRHAQIASAMLSIRHGAKLELPALASSAGELGALEAQMAAEQGAAFLKIASTLAPAQVTELARAAEDAARQSQKKP